jgi:hypothetical protein
MSAELNFRRKVAAAVRESFEGLAFLSVEEAAAGPGPQSPRWSWVRVNEPCPGTVALALPEAVARMIAGAMLGTATPSKAEEADAQSEMTNVIAGRLVKGLIGPDAVLNLGLPRTGRGAPSVTEPGWISMDFSLASERISVHVNGPGLMAAMEPATRTGSSTDITRIHPGADGATGDAKDGDDQSDDVVRIGGYRIIEMLGRGGMGVVYKARHETLEREAALKVLLPEYSSDQNFAARFLREARSAAKIDHPNVVSVYDAGSENGSLYLAMRYVSGGDLAQMLVAVNTLPIPDALTLTARCLLGLQAIEANGLVHRDIKPANILLELDGTPRIADLGLARPVRGNDGITLPGAAQGTPSYMSPEQARGEKDLDIRSDIYSLGTTLYTMVAGKPPFAAESAFDTVAKVLYEPPPSPRTHQPSIPIEVERLIMHALLKDRNERYQNPAEFLEAIEAVMQTREVMRLSESARLKSASSPSTAEQPQKSTWVKRLLGNRPAK